MKRTLFEIGADLAALDQLCNDAEDDMARAPEMDAALAAWFDELKDAEDVKLEGYRLYIAKLESEAAAAKAEAEQFAKMAKVREGRVKWLKDRVKQYMEFTRRERILTSTNRVFAIQANGGAVPVLMDNVPPEDMPEQFQRVKIEFNIDAIRKALVAGEEVPFARLGERGTHLRIK